MRAGPLGATPAMAPTLDSARPSFGVFGRLLILLSRKLADDYWKPTGHGKDFRYGTGRTIPRHAGEQLAGEYKRRMDERGYRYPSDSSKLGE